MSISSTLFPGLLSGCSITSSGSRRVSGTAEGSIVSPQDSSRENSVQNPLVRWRGIKGVFEAAFLAAVQDTLDSPLASYFDLLPVHQPEHHRSGAGSWRFSFRPIGFLQIAWPADISAPRCILAELVALGP